MKENAMRKWGAWIASAVFVVVTAILAIASGDRAEAKGNASVRSSAQSSAPAAAESGTHLANADRDVLDLQLD